MLRLLTSDCAYAVSLQQPSELRRALLLPGAGLACGSVHPLDGLQRRAAANVVAKFMDSLPGVRMV